MKRIFIGIFGLFSVLFCVSLFAHGITGPDQAFLLSNVGTQIGVFIYLGAKHMVTGYDHLLFLAGVIFFLYLKCVISNLSTDRQEHSKQ